MTKILPTLILSPRILQNSEPTFFVNKGGNNSTFIKGSYPISANTQPKQEEPGKHSETPDYNPPTPLEPAQEPPKEQPNQPNQTR
ncbi:MAG: hypothetical protein QNJ31_07870 [Candidatus Caenarcaniphilales bacterium]|nr:hypothetical protein [Candidatus Caenarcaniphilales bacterium]